MGVGAPVSRRPPGGSHVTRRAGLAVAAALVAVAVVIAVVVVTSGDRRSALDVVVAPHPDDEMQAWSLLAGTTEAHTVFAFLTRGEETSLCQRALPGLDAASGEVVPRPRPRGRWTDSCAQARMNATIAFLERMGDDDPGLPDDYDEGVRTGLAGSPGGQRCDDGDCHDVGDVVVHAGDGATVVFFDLGDGDLTTDEVDDAIATLVDHGGELGIPDLPRRRLVAASYYNDDQPTCVRYPHPDHRAVTDAVDGAPHGFPERFVATCRTPDADLVGRAVDPDVWAATFDVADDGTRIGPHPVLYGWLLDPYWPDDPDPGSQDELFHRDQVFVHHGGVG